MCRFYGRPRCGRCLQWSVATDDDPMVDAEEDAEAPEEELQLRVVVASKVGFATEKLLRSPLLLLPVRCSNQGSYRRSTSSSNNSRQQSI